jgi:hypothetical protein
MINLGIALPLTSEVEHTQFWNSFHVMRKGDHVFIRPDFPGPIDIVRNELVKKAFEAGCSHLLMMDTDQIYPIDTLDKMKLLFQNPEVKVVSNIVHRRYEPFDPLAFMLCDGKDGEQHLMRLSDEELFAPGIIKVDATGFGCIMFDMEVFNEMPSPWFVDRAYQQARDFDKVKVNGHAPGEDIGFCMELKKRSIPIYVDTTVEIDHLSLVAVNRGLYKLYNAINSKKEEKNANKKEV